MDLVTTPERRWTMCVREKSETVVIQTFIAHTYTNTVKGTYILTTEARDGDLECPK